MRGVLARTPLRVKLVAAMLGLVVAALALVGVASVLLVHRHLLQGVDGQITTVAQEGARGALQAALGTDPPADRAALAGDDKSAGPTLLPSQFVIQLNDSAGSLVQQRRSPLHKGEPGPDVPADAGWLDAHVGHPATVAATSGDAVWRVVVAAVPGGHGSVLVGMDLGEVNGTVRLLSAIEAGAGGVVVLVLAGVGVAIVRSSLRPLAEIERTAAAIASGDLSRRVPDRDARTEVGRLGRALNAMLAQIEEAFAARARSEARMRRFVADAGHELRTPLSVIRGFAEYYRQRSHREPSDVDRMVGHVEDTAARMGRLVDDLLLLARLDAQRPLQRLPVDLLAVVADVVRDARLIDPDRRLGFVFGCDTAFLVDGDEARLRQVVGNLVDNALAHPPAGTPIEVRVFAGRLDTVSAAVIEVADEGPGLTAEQAGRVFERFYRADPSRNSGSGRQRARSVHCGRHRRRAWRSGRRGHRARCRSQVPRCPAVGRRRRGT
jgi:two-component system OmpR family sensor kinase